MGINIRIKIYLSRNYRDRINNLISVTFDELYLYYSMLKNHWFQKGQWKKGCSPREKNECNKQPQSTYVPALLKL